MESSASAVAALVAGCAPDAGYDTCLAFTYEGVDQSFTVPAGVTSLSVKAWGAGGGGGVRNPGVWGAPGGAGGYVAGTVPVTPGDEFVVMVGGGGAPDGTLDPALCDRAYGFGGACAGPNPAFDGFVDGGGGGGLSGLFAGSAAVAETAQARALFVAGGGGASETTNYCYDSASGVFGHASGGAGGNAFAGTGANASGMRGADGFGDFSTVVALTGGGGGYQGGGKANGRTRMLTDAPTAAQCVDSSNGGSNFVAPTATATASLAGAEHSSTTGYPDVGVNLPPNTTDAHYSLAPFVGQGLYYGHEHVTSGHGLVVIQYTAPVIEPVYDHGDAPRTYGTLTGTYTTPDGRTIDYDGARHQITGWDATSGTGALMLGSVVDHETDGPMFGHATEDDAGGIDDEDGVVSPISFISATPQPIAVAYTNNTGSAATLAGWIDLDGNYLFDASERQTIAVPPGTGTVDLTFPVPSVPGTTFARFRLFPGLAPDPQPEGTVVGGEVEDYPVSGPNDVFGCGVPAPNSSFEVPNLDEAPYAPYNFHRFPGFPSYSTGLPTIGGWDVVSGTIDLKRWWVNASDGQQSIDLWGTSPSVVQRTFTGLTPGDEYTFSVDYSGIDGNSQATIALDTGGGLTNLQTLSPVAPWTGNTGVPPDATENTFVWATFTHTFTATGTSATVRFTQREAPGWYSTGLFIDNFRFDSPECHFYDFGDAPDSYGTLLADNGPSHDIVGYDEEAHAAPLMLGASVDAESDGQPGEDADGDDTADVGDDDAVAGTIELTLGQQTSVSVSVTNDTGVDATLAGWIDLDGNGVFDASELQTVPVSGSGVYELTFATPAALGDTFARFRLFPGAVAGPEPTGAVLGGEVEDYPVTVTLPSAPVCNVAANGSFESPDIQNEPNGPGDFTQFVNGWAIWRTTTNPIDGWETTSGTVDILRYYSSASDGAQSIDLYGTAAATFEQTFTGLLPGAVYTFSVDYSGHSTAQSSADLSLDLGSGFQLVSSLAPIADSVANGNGGLPGTPQFTMAWSTFTHAFVATGSEATIRFVNTGVFSTTGTGVFIDNFSFGGQAPCDFGDAPDGFGTVSGSNGPRHAIPGYDAVSNTAPLMLGATIDGEGDGQPGPDAGGDGPDEDGAITGPIVMGAGAPSTVRVAVTNTTGGDATLVGWIDLNGDGDFDDGGEMASVPAPATGDYDLAFGAPTTTEATYARFRLFPGTVTDPQPTGPAAGGEVEDYRVDVFGFELAKSANPASGVAVRVGDTVTYTVTVTNVGTVPLTDVAFDDDMSGVLDDAELILGPLVSPVTAGVVTVDAGVLSFVGDVGVEGVVTVTYVVAVLDPSESGGDGMLANAVVGGDCPDPAITDPQHPSFDPDCAAVHPIRDVAVRKSSDPADGSTVAPGDTVTYTVEITNTGGYAYTVDDPADVVDDLSGVIDDALYNNDADDAGHVGTLNYSAPELTWAGPLARGETVTITYTATVRSGENLGDAELENVVTGVDSNCVDPPITNPADPDYRPDCHNLVEVGAVHYLKTVDPPDPLSLQPGDTFTYTVTATNVGAVDLTGLTFTDDLSGVLDDATFVVGSETADIGTAAFDGVGALEWAGDLAIGDVATVTYQITIDTPPGGDSNLINGVVGTGPGTNCPPPGPATDADCFKQIPQPLINTVKTSNRAGNVAPGDVVIYEFTVSNTGTGPAHPFEVVDDLSDALDDADFDGTVTLVSGPGAVAYDAVNQEVVWTGPLLVGQSATVTYSVTVNDATALGDGVLSNAVTSPDCIDPPVTDPHDGDFDPNCVTNNPVEAWVAVKTSDDAGIVVPGDTVNYTIAVTNTGGVALSGIGFTDDLSAVLDDAAFDVGSVTVPFGDIGFDPVAAEFTWGISPPDVLAVDEVVVITYAVTVNDATELGDGVLVNAVAGPTNCPSPAIGDPQNPDFDPACATVQDVEAWTAIKTSDVVGNVEPGDTVDYEITVTNTGNVAVGATVVDDLADVLDDATLADDADDGGHAGTFDFTTPLLTWSGDLAVDEVVTLTYSVTVGAASELGDGELVNVITGPTNCPSATITDPQDPDFDPDCVNIVDVAAWTAVKTSGAFGAVAPGDTVDYEITVTNTGNVALTAAQVVNVDDLTDVLDDASYDGNADDGNHAGTFEFTTPLLTWSGDLAVGEVVTLTYSVTINDATDLGDGELVNAITGPPDCPNPAITDPTDPDFRPGCVNIEQVAAYTVVKTSAVVGPVLPGDVVEYSLVVTNTGNVDLTGTSAASLVDDLSGVLDDASFNDAVADVGTPAFADPVLSWTGDLGVDDVATITYSVTVDRPIRGDHELVNAVVGGDCPEPAVTDAQAVNFDPDCVTITALPGVRIDKVIFGGPVDQLEPGDSFEYVVTVENIGEVDLVGETFTDDLSDVLDDAELDQGSLTTDIGAVDFADPTLVWTGDLAIGEEATIRYTVTIDDPLTGDGELFNAVVGPIYSNCAPPEPYDAGCWEDTPVPNVVVSKQLVGPAEPQPGDVVTYRITAENRGGATAIDAEITDDLSGVLDDAVYRGDAAATLVGALSYTEPVITWVGDIAAGQTLVITYTVTVNDDHELGDAQLDNTVTGGENCPAADECTTSKPLPTYEAVKTRLSPTEIGAGAIVTYQVTITNTSDVTAHTAAVTDDLSAVLDDAVYTGDASATAGTVSYAEPALSWNGALAAGEVVTLTYSVAVNATGQLGDGVLENTISAPNCIAPAVSDECQTRDEITAVRYDKSIVSPAGPIRVGDIVTYAIVVTNTGGAPITPATFDDDLTGVLDDGVLIGTPSASSGSVSYASPVITWTGDLNPGDTATVTYQIRTTAGGNGRLENSVVSDDTGSNCPDGANAAECVTVANLVVSPPPSTTTPRPTVPPGGPLPGTGSSTTQALQITVVLLLSGGVLLVLARRRRHITQ